MDLLRSTSQFSGVRFMRSYHPSRTHTCRRFVGARSSLPFPKHQAKYHKELEAAVDAVERACCLCVDVKKSLFSSEGRIMEKNDQTPVTVADFGVQALISLELSKLFPDIPLVAEEDSAFLRSNNLVDTVVSAVTDRVSFGDESLTQADVLEGIDRGGKDAFTFCTKPATYWVLDPIDGTRGFLKGSDAMYVVGLALVVEGDIVLGVMGCPNWKDDSSYRSRLSSPEVRNNENITIGPGVIMLAHAGCGTWTKSLSKILGISAKMGDGWTRCFVDGCVLVQKARFCISDSQTWESLPLSTSYNAKTEIDDTRDDEVTLLHAYCGSLCKYLMVASGRASAFVYGAKPQTVIKAWDHVVGVMCVHEAGGKVTDWEGNQLDLEADQAERRIIYPAGGVLVSNGKIHKEILDIVSSSSSIV